MINDEILLQSFHVKRQSSFTPRMLLITETRAMSDEIILTSASIHFTVYIILQPHSICISWQLETNIYLQENNALYLSFVNIFGLYLILFDIR